MKNNELTMDLKDDTLIIKCGERRILCNIYAAVMASMKDSLISSEETIKYD